MEGITQIGSLQPGLKNLKMQVILLEKKFSTKLKREQLLAQFLVSDGSGSCLCNFYDDVALGIKEGDIIRLTGAYSSLFKQNLVLYSTNKQGFGEVKRVGEFYMNFSVKPFVSEDRWEREWDEANGIEKYFKVN